MQIVTDRAADLSPQQLEGLDIHYIPLTLTLGNKQYRSGVDIQPDDFYQLLEKSDDMPTTSQPSPGEFAELYRELAATDPDILSIHVSSGLSGTLNAARLGAEQVPEARVTHIDTKTLSAAEGWQVEAAARALKAGKSIDEIRALLTQIGNATDTIFTLPTLKYLIHGGRISHLKGLIASTLNIKPLIGVDKTEGKYAQRGQVRTFSRAVEAIPQTIAKHHAPGTRLRVQIMHAHNPEGAEILRKSFASVFDCEWMPISPIAPVLGAHTGPGLVGAVYAPVASLPQ
jgi:DegV family protein with EDD domain